MEIRIGTFSLFFNIHITRLYDFNSCCDQNRYYLYATDQSLTHTLSIGNF